MARVRVRLFAILRESVGKETVELEVPEGASCQELVSQFDLEFGPFEGLLKRSFIAVNGEYSPPAAPVSPGDEVALLPPVSGG